MTVIFYREMTAPYERVNKTAWKYSMIVFNSWMFGINIRTKHSAEPAFGEDLRLWESQLISPGCCRLIDVLVVHVVRPSKSLLQLANTPPTREPPVCSLPSLAPTWFAFLMRLSRALQRQSNELSKSSRDSPHPSFPSPPFLPPSAPIKHLYQRAHAPARYRANFLPRRSAIKTDGWRPCFKWSEVSI